MIKKTYLAYEGIEFTIEWYLDSNGESQAFDYYCSLTQKEKLKLYHLFKRMGDYGKISDKTKFNYENDQIYAFKPKPDRFLCFFYQGKRLVITNAFRKKQDKLPANEKQKALKNKRDYEIRVKEGSYYD